MAGLEFEWHCMDENGEDCGRVLQENEFPMRYIYDEEGYCIEEQNRCIYCDSPVSTRSVKRGNHE